MNFVWAPWQCCGYKLKWFGFKFFAGSRHFLCKTNGRIPQINSDPDSSRSAISFGVLVASSEKLSSIFIEWFLNSLSLLSDEGTIFKCAILKWKKTYTQYIKIWKITFSPPPPLFSPLIYNSVWNTYTQRYPHIMWGL